MMLIFGIGMSFENVVQFLHGMNAVAAVFYGIAALTVLIQIYSMFKMRKNRKIAYRMPLLINTMDIVFHITYLISYETTLFMFAVKLWGEYLLFKAHRTQKKELKRLKEEAKAAAVAEQAREKEHTGDVFSDRIKKNMYKRSGRP